MLPGLKEYLDQSMAHEILLGSFMKWFPDIHDKDHIIGTWTGAVGYLQQHTSWEKRKLSVTLHKFTSLELKRIVDKELQEVGGKR